MSCWISNALVELCRPGQTTMNIKINPVKCPTSILQLTTCGHPVRTSSPGCSANKPSIVRSAKFSAVKGALADDAVDEPPPLEWLALDLLLVFVLPVPPALLVDPLVRPCIVAVGNWPPAPTPTAPPPFTDSPEFVVELTSGIMCMFQRTPRTQL